MELILSIVEIIAWVVACAIVVFGVFMVAAVACYAYVTTKGTKEDE